MSRMGDRAGRQRMTPSRGGQDVTPMELRRADVLVWNYVKATGGGSRDGLASGVNLTSGDARVYQPR
ncbi:hypothetical protein [Camelimonas lactis]|uniref:Uncharacterized protein n=1 Tax=Camelimonas lactis TaxID=659006 RepID=A0A4R2GX53_9HYPH|nr:hypothetical protein [Camelimonas lactis]TCO15782.1 hypothetical protein EV666_10129 [Camelimonas lactis]